MISEFKNGLLELAEVCAPLSVMLPWVNIINKI